MSRDFYSINTVFSPIFYVSKVFGLLPFTLVQQNRKAVYRLSGVSVVYGVLLITSILAFCLLTCKDVLSEIRQNVRNPTEKFMQQADILLTILLVSVAGYVHLFSVRRFPDFLHKVQDVCVLLEPSCEVLRTLFLKTLFLTCCMLSVSLSVPAISVWATGNILVLVSYHILVSQLLHTIVATQFSVTCFVPEEMMLLVNHQVVKTLSAYKSSASTMTKPISSGNPKEESSKSLQGRDQATELFRLRLCRNQLCDASAKVFQIYEVQLVFILMTNFLGIISSLFVAIFGFYGEDVYEGNTLPAIFICLLLNVTSVFAILIPAEMLHSQGKMTGVALYKHVSRWMDNDTKEEIAGAVTTYLVILIQLQPVVRTEANTTHVITTEGRNFSDRYLNMNA